MDRDPLARERSTDHGFWCSMAYYAGLFWDFIDKRDLDKHAMSWAVLFGTWYLVDWTLEYIYAHPDKSGVELGLIVAAYMLPWSGLQAAVIKFYFEARSS